MSQAAAAAATATAAAKNCLSIAISATPASEQVCRAAAEATLFWPPSVPRGGRRRPGGPGQVGAVRRTAMKRAVSFESLDGPSVRKSACTAAAAQHRRTERTGRRRRMRARTHTLDQFAGQRKRGNESEEGKEVLSLSVPLWAVLASLKLRARSFLVAAAVAVATAATAPAGVTCSAWRSQPPQTARASERG